MNWFHHRKTGPSEATLARMEAERRLAETRSQTPEAEALGASMRRIREINHMSQKFYEIHTRGT